MRLIELGMRSVALALHRGLFERALHALNLAVRPRMVRLGRSVFDVVGVANHAEHTSPRSRRGADAVLRQISKLNAVVCQHDVDFVGNGFDKGFEKVCSRPAIALFMQFGISEL